MIQKRVAFLILLFMASAGIFVTPIFGQAIFRPGTSTLIVNDSTNSWDSFEGIAADSSGNLYIGGCSTGGADAYSNVCKETLQPDGTYVESLLFTKAANGLNQAYYVAVDTSNNVYIADTMNSRVLKETLSGGTYTQSVVTDFHNGLIFPNQIAVDTAGNVYVTDFDNKRVLKETPSGSTYTQSIIGSGFSQPYAVAVDTAGTVYIGDSGLGVLYKETLSGGVYTQSVISSNFSNGFEDLAVDLQGNIYVTAAFSSVQILVPTTTGYLYNSQNLLPVASGWGVTLDSAGNIYATGNSHQVTKFNLAPVSFGAVTVGSTGPAVTVPLFAFSAYNGSTATTQLSGSAVSNGITGEFTNTHAGTCDTNGMHSYARGETCTVTVTFSPKAAGLRTGAVELVNAENVVWATVYISAMGTAPQVAFSSGPQTTVASGLVSPNGVTVNGSGIVYIADPGTPGYLFVETPSGSSYTQTTINYGAGAPPGEQTLLAGVTTDGAGNLYFSNSNSNNTYGNTVETLEFYNGVFWGGPTPLADPQQGNALTGPTGLASDPSGNVYVADTGNNRVVEELFLAGVTYNTYFPLQFVVGSGLSAPQAVSTDAAGNVYVADTGNNRILLDKPTGTLGGFTQSVLFSAGLNAPAGVAVDGFGNVFVSDTGNKRVLMELRSSGGTYTQYVVPVTGLVSPKGLSLDSTENLFLADSGSGSVYKIALGSGPTLNFASTNVGSTSSDSPQTVTFSNIGNAALTFPIPGSGTNPSVSASFSVSTTGGTACPMLTTSTGSVAALAAATSCTLPISFTPASSGSITGTVKTTDNALNASGTVQTINLNGTGVSVSSPVASLSPTSIAFSNQVVSTTSTVSAITLSNTGSASLTGIVVSITGANPTDFAQTNNCGTTLATGANCTISVTFTPASVASYAATISVADNASGSPQTATLTGSGMAVPTPQAVLSPTSLSFGSQTNGTSSTSQSITLSNPGTAALAIGSVAITGSNSGSFSQSNTCGATLTAGSSCLISVTFAPQAAGALAAAVTVTDNAVVTTQTATLSGTGVAPLVPLAALTPSSLTFANQLVNTTSAAQVVTLNNTGGAALTISGVTLNGAGSSSYADTTTCGVTLAAGASCSISVTFLPTAVASYSATLSVADNAAGSPQVVSLAGAGVSPTDFGISAPTPVASVANGSVARFMISVAALNGSYSSPVVMSVTGLPAGATASFSPASVTPGSTGVTTVLSVQTPSLLARGEEKHGAWFAALLFLPLLGLRRMRRKIGLVGALLLCAIVLPLAGCSGGFFGPTAHTSTLIITGTSGAVQHSTTVTLTVQ